MCAFGFLRRHARSDQRAQPVVVLGPVHQGCAAASGIGPGTEVPGVGDPAVNPEPVPIAPGIESSTGRLERDRIAVRQVEQLPRPGRIEPGNVVAPEIILGRPIDRVVLALEVIHGEAAGDGLLNLGTWAARGVRLAGLGLALGADHELDAGQRQQVPQLGRIQKIRGDQGTLVASLAISDDHRLDPVPHDLGPDRLVLQQDEQSGPRTRGGRASRSGPPARPSARGKAVKPRPGPD